MAKIIDNLKIISSRNAIITIYEDGKVEDRKK